MSSQIAQLIDIPDDILFGTNVFLRVDFNVPLSFVKKNEENEKDSPSYIVLSYSRIIDALKTINFLIDKGSKIVIFSHLGRPKSLSSIQERKKKLSLHHISNILSTLINKEVKFVDDCIGEKIQNEINNMENGQVIMAENTRFYDEEEGNNEDFSRELAEPFSSGKGVFVNDAFSTSHRSHSSNVGVTKFINICVSGFHLQKEYDYLSKVLLNPSRPFAALIGGAKVSSKITVINNLLDHVDKLLIGGGMVFTFYRAMGYEIGNSLVENEYIDTALQIITSAKNKGVELFLAEDCIVTDSIVDPNIIETVRYNEIENGMIGVDIGNETFEVFCRELNSCKTILWNGPMGIYEKEEFRNGTSKLIEFIASLTSTTSQSDVITIIAGGDTSSAIHINGNLTFSHISSGGGATLEFLEGRVLPGIKVLNTFNELSSILHKHLHHIVNINKSANKYPNYSTNELKDIIDMNQDIKVSPKNKRDNYDIINENKDYLDENNTKFFKEICGGISNQKTKKEKEC